MRCGGLFNDHFITRLLLSLAVKEFLQEAQLMLTNHATRLEVSQGHQTWYHSTC